MEKLTEFRFEGSNRVQAWCEVCGKWIEQVKVCLDCNTSEGTKDYVYCKECNTAILEGTPRKE